MTDDGLQFLIHTYEAQALSWDTRADDLESFSPGRVWDADQEAEVVHFRRQAEACRNLAQEVRDSGA